MTDPQYPQYPGYRTPPSQPGYPQPMPYQGYSQAPAQPPAYPYGAQYPAVVAPPPPANNLALAIVGLLFFWPIGLAAILNAAKVDSMHARGQWNAAYVLANQAKRYAIWAIAIGCVITVLYIMLNVAAAAGTR